MFYNVWKALVPETSAQCSYLYPRPVFSAPGEHMCSKWRLLEIDILSKYHVVKHLCSKLRVLWFTLKVGPRKWASSSARWYEYDIYTEGRSTKMSIILEKLIFTSRVGSLQIRKVEIYTEGRSTKVDITPQTGSPESTTWDPRNPHMGDKLWWRLKVCGSISVQPNLFICKSDVKSEA